MLSAAAVLRSSAILLTPLRGFLLVSVRVLGRGLWDVWASLQVVTYEGQIREKPESMEEATSGRSDGRSKPIDDRFC